MTVIEETAEWVSGLNRGDIPERVLEIARHQVLSVMGAICAGANCAGGRAVMDAVAGWAGEGPCTLFPGGGSRALNQALLQNCSLSMALDYDDYLFLGHTGHSAVVVPLAAAQEVDADTETMLVAQVAANEVAGRLGGSVVLGPHNGQMWAHIHLLGAAAAASRVLGLDAERTADAMGTALAEPVYALFPGFMGPQSKLLTAAVPAQTGSAAAFLAGSGMTGSRVILEDPEGFWAHFSFLPLPFMMTGLGRAWVTDTIAFKPYPGCAYIDTAEDALFAILDGFARERGRPLEPDEVREINVEASLLTVAMDAMSRTYMNRGRLSPTNINFSLSVSLAISILAGTLSGAQLVEGFLDDNREKILALASRVNLAHDASRTVNFARSLDGVVDLEAMVAQLDFKGLMKARRRLREHISRVGTMGPREALAAWRSLSAYDRAFLRGLVSLRALLSDSPDYDLGEARLEELEMPFGAHVAVALKDGTVMESEKEIPRGGPGDPGRLEVPVEKFLRESAPFLSEKRAGAAVDMVLDIESSSLDEVVGALTSAD